MIIIRSYILTLTALCSSVALSSMTPAIRDTIAKLEQEQHQSFMRASILAGAFVGMLGNLSTGGPSLFEDESTDALFANLIFPKFLEYNFAHGLSLVRDESSVYRQNRIIEPTERPIDKKIRFLRYVRGFCLGVTAGSLGHVAPNVIVRPEAIKPDMLYGTAIMAGISTTAILLITQQIHAATKKSENRVKLTAIV